MPARSVSMHSTTMGSRITSFIPLSSRSASLAEAGMLGWRMRLRSSTGSVEASAAPRMAAAARERPSSSQRGEREQRRRQQRPGAQNENGEPPLQADLADVHPDRVGEQHEHEAERSDDAERRRREAEVDQSQAGGAEHGADQQEDGHLRHSGPLDRAGEQRGDDDDDADEGEQCGEAVVTHRLKYTQAPCQRPSRSPPPYCSPRPACSWGRACCSAGRRSGSGCRSCCCS